jgi:hypothetical protein
MTHRMSRRSVLSKKFVTVAEMLGDHGYKSYAVVGNPNAGSPRLGFNRGYDEVTLVYKEENAKAEQTVKAGAQYRVVLPEHVEAAIVEVLPQIADSGTYTYIHYLQPHKPYDAPPRYAVAAGAGTTECVCDGAPCRCGDIDWDTIDESFDHANEAGRASASLIGHVKARYRANIRYVDEAVGHLLEQLREHGLYEQSLIVLLADHGDAFFQHKRFGHNRTLYDDMVRIPLLMKFPASAHVKPRRLDALAETIDVVPTIFDFLGFAMSKQWEGESLWPLIAGTLSTPAPAHREVILATNLFDIQAIRVEEFKLIVSKTGSVELYDLRADPDEQDDLAGRQLDRVQVLRAHLDSVVKAAGAPHETKASELRADPEMDQLLEALGYLRDEDDPISPPREASSDTGL